MRDAPSQARNRGVNPTNPESTCDDVPVPRPRALNSLDLSSGWVFVEDHRLLVEF